MIEIDKLAPLLELLQRHGVQQIKMDGLELSFVNANPPMSIAPQVPIDAPAPTSEPIKHTSEEMTNVMKLSDHEMVDMLFPVTKADEATAQ
jgi:hypothetical protein